MGSGFDKRTGVGKNVVAALLATASVYGFLFGTGLFLYGNVAGSVTTVLISVVTFWICLRQFRQDQIG